jgi:hypothetical protein
VTAPKSSRITDPREIFASCSPKANLLLPEIDEVRVSVAFTYDRELAEQLAKAWERVGVPVEVGGPAYGKQSGEFIPGLYVRPGVTFSSRGCPNHCWFCNVWRREKEFKQLQIKPGHIVQDDNLLACSPDHIKAVFDMLKQQPEPAIFSGGIEAKRLTSGFCQQLAEIKPKSVFFAYDTPDDYRASRRGWAAHAGRWVFGRLSYYVLLCFNRV